MVTANICPSSYPRLTDHLDPFCRGTVEYHNDHSDRCVHKRVGTLSVSEFSVSEFSVNEFRVSEFRGLKIGTRSNNVFITLFIKAWYSATDPCR